MRRPLMRAAENFKKLTRFHDDQRSKKLSGRCDEDYYFNVPNWTSSGSQQSLQTSEVLIMRYNLMQLML